MTSQGWSLGEEITSQGSAGAWGKEISSQGWSLGEGNNLTGLEPLGRK